MPVKQKIKKEGGIDKISHQEGPSQGILGGVKFELSCCVELIPEEQELVKNKAHREPLTYEERKGVEIPLLYVQESYQWGVLQNERC